MFWISFVLILGCGLVYLSSPLPFGTENYDSYELITAMVTGGIAHAPGYSIYLMLNRGFNQLLSGWIQDPAITMTIFQYLCACLALIIGLIMVRSRKGSALQFTLLMLSCTPFVECFYSVEVYGFLIFLFATSFWLYCFRIESLKVKLQDTLLCLILGFLISHHLSMIPLALCILCRLYIERSLDSKLIAALSIGPTAHISFSYLAARTIMNPWFDGSSFGSLLEHLSAEVYRKAFLNFGIHLDSMKDFFSVWPWFIWILICILVVYIYFKAYTCFELAFLVLLIWPLFSYNIPDISKQLLPFYYSLALLIACKKNNWVLASILLLLSFKSAYLKLVEFELLEFKFEHRSMQQCLKDARTLVSRKPDQKHVFAGYDSTFAIAYAVHVKQFAESNNMSIFPMWWLAYTPHLESIKNKQFRSDLSSTSSIHWTALKHKTLIQLYDRLIESEKHQSAVSASGQSQKFLRVLELMKEEDSLFYVPAGKLDWLHFLKFSGYRWINSGSWNQVLLDPSKFNKQLNSVQRVYLQKDSNSNFLVHILFLDKLRSAIQLHFSSTEAVHQTTRLLATEQDRITLDLPPKYRALKVVELQITDFKNNLLSHTRLHLE